MIDAYDGTIEAYVADPGDPLIRTYAKAFPGILRRLAEMPADLRAHIRYPEDLFRAQTALYATYHMNEPEIFFHREDQWQIPTPPEGSARNPYLRTHGDEAAGRDAGGVHVYRFPRQSLVFGPTQILNRINQNTEISQQISLWDQHGSQVIRGNLLVIPIGGSLIFVQALYLRAEGSRIPELKRVIVAYQNKVTMEEALDASLARLFGGVLPPPPTPRGREAPQPVAGANVAELARQAAEHYDRAIAAQRIGDWATYGAEIKQVGELLRRLRSPGAPPP